MPYYRAARGDQYCAHLNGVLTRLPSGERVTDQHILTAHQLFRSMILSDAYTCVGASSAVRRGDYRFGLLPELASAAAVLQCGAFLSRFLDEFRASRPVGIFVAVFSGPLCHDEEHFEELLWRQLQGLHDHDSQPSWWKADDPLEWDDEIGFLFQNRNFFIVGMHPAASRWSRRFAWPTLAFNLLSHMEPLERTGRFGLMQARIRARDQRLQGSVSPALELRQVAQFSGRPVPSDWRFPLEPRDLGHPKH